MKQGFILVFPFTEGLVHRKMQLNPLNGRFASGRPFSVEIIKGVNGKMHMENRTPISLVSRKYLQPRFGEERTKCVLIVAWF